MKKTYAILLTVLFLFNTYNLDISAESSAASYTFYVALDGADNANGSAENPFRTVERARTAVRDLRDLGIDEYAEIIIRGGEYFRFRPFVLTSRDYNMKISAYPGEKVTFSGGKTVSADKITSAAGTDIYERVIEPSAKEKLMCADLSELYYYTDVLPEHNAYNAVVLYENGEPFVMPSYPDNKEAAVSMNEITDGGFKSSAISERAAAWSDDSLNNAYIYGHLSSIWYIDFSKINSYSRESNIISANSYSGKYSAPESGFLVCNIPEEINSPGECYIDRVGKKAYFYPREENMTLSVPIAQSSFISADSANNIEINGIDFEYTRSNFLDIKNSKKITIKNCSFRHFMTTNTVDGDENLISKCTFYDGASGGIVFSGGDTRNLTGGKSKIENCVFDSVSRITPSYRFAAAIYGFENVLKDSELKSSDHALLSLGGVGTLIDGNKIHDGVKWASDMAAVYYGRTPLTVGAELKNNTFYNNYSGYNNHNSASIYWDDRSVGPYIHDNVFIGNSADTTYALKSNAGVYATISRNIFKNIKPLENIDYNFNKNKHVVFWLLCNSKPTLTKGDSSFEGWWEKICESGYFDKWQEYFRGSEWEDYMHMLTAESHSELDGAASQSELLAIADKYAPGYGINKFTDNIVSGCDASGEWYENTCSYNTVSDNVFTDNTDVLYDSEMEKKCIDDAAAYGVGAYVKNLGNDVFEVKGIAGNTEKPVALRVMSGDDLVFMEQCFATNDGSFSFKFMAGGKKMLKAEVNCGGKKKICFYR